METINSMASSAAKMVWGENNTDTNDTTKTDSQKPLTDRTANPATDNTKMTTETQSQEPISGKLGDTTKEPTQSQTPGLQTSKDPITEAPGATSTQTKAHTIETAGETVGTKGPTSEHPSTTGDHGGFKAAQADIRDPETSATTDPKVEAQRKNVDDTGALDEGRNPAKADGPGPKPIEEVARERGGDAANIGGANKKDDVDPEGLGGKSESKGTGEQYVKTSGLKADGGDFDATKPGAGREADRLLEEKGIQTPAAAAAANKKSEPGEAPSSPDSKKDKDKPSLKEKIKAKLHKN
ncbi:unnamed protein product [Discula destructiva]